MVLANRVWFGVVSLAVLLHGCGSMPVSSPVGEGNGAPATTVTQNSGVAETQPLGESSPAITNAPRHITVAAVGDIMLGSDYPEDALPPADGRDMLAAVAPLLSAADIAIGNLEGVVMDGGQPFKQCQNNGRCYVFRTPGRYVQHLASAGFDVLSLANNHARDFGEAGRSASMAHLDAVAILHSGRSGDVARWQVADSRIAYIAFAPYDGSHDMRDIAAMQRQVAELAQQHDIVIVSFHGGAEGSDAIHVPFTTELFHGENRGDVALFARSAVEAGADLVLGHGPHVPRGIELHHDRLIVYSLGNFATYQGINVAGRNGLAPVVVVTLEADGRFVGGQIHSHIQQRPGGPQPDPTHGAARLMARVTREDFADPGVTIFANGTIERSAVATAQTGNDAGKIAPARVE